MKQTTLGGLNVAQGLPKVHQRQPVSVSSLKIAASFFDFFTNALILDNETESLLYFIGLRAFLFEQQRRPQAITIRLLTIWKTNNCHFRLVGNEEDLYLYSNVSKNLL